MFYFFPQSSSSAHSQLPDDNPSQRFHWSTLWSVERRVFILWVLRCYPLYSLWRCGGTGLGLVGYTTVHTYIPGVEEDVLPVQPGTVGQAHLHHGHPYHPVWGGAQLAHKGQQVVPVICVKTCESFAIEILMLKTPSFDNSFDLPTLLLQLILQHPDVPLHSQQLQSLASLYSWCPQTRKSY